MNHVNLIKQLDFKPNHVRREIIEYWLNEIGVAYSTQKYGSGVNLWVDLGCADKKIGISSHFDRVPIAGGANDNGSALAVSLDIIQQFTEKGNDEMGLRIFFFDEEENGLKGSSAYTHRYGVKDIVGLINLELVGLGDKLAIWPLNQTSWGILLETFEKCSEIRNIKTKRFDKIVTNTSDHLSFRKAGLEDAFTITCISDRDIEAAHHYYKALEQGVSSDILFKLLSKAPIFLTYHQPEDTYENIDEKSILMTSSLLWDTINAINEIV